MSSAPEGEIGLGLGYATALLQLHLGLGLALTVLGIAVASGGALPKTLSAVPWEETLRAAARAASQVPLLAAFALIQACGAVPDGLSLVGLLVSSVSVFLGTFLAIAGPVCGWEASEVAADDESPAERPAGFYISLARRVVSSLCAVGEAILIFGAVPSGLQLLSASLIMRLALGVHAVGAAGHALSLHDYGALFAALADVERMAPLAPLVGTLALLDHLAWGPSSLLMAPLQPVLYCALAGVMQVGLILVAHHGHDSSVQDAPGNAAFDVRFFLGEDSSAAGVDSLSRATATGLYLALVAGVGRILVGTFEIEVSMGRLAVAWGEPLFASAALLAALLVATYAAELLLSRFTEAKPRLPMQAAMNGNSENHADLDTTQDSINEDTLEAPSTMDHVKAIVAPVISLVLALAAVHMSLPSTPTTGAAGPSATAMLASAMTAPFRYGLLAVAAAVALQVLTLFVFNALRSDATVEPILDCTGTLQWEPESELVRVLAMRLRSATLLLLGGGLFLGILGMGGVRWWAPAKLALALLLYVLATPEARSKANAIAQAFAGLAGMQLEEHRLAWEAARAKKAALQAAALEAEIAASASADAKSGKPAVKAAGKAAAASWKAPKEKSSEKKGSKKKHT
mmetsp:Transcript_67007/g.143313  ORF Transcript_67007/g.143313 Transcript_67007/m.143313 type:complete len:631 (-) Transcript_67007:63-1955(-)